MRPVGPVRIAFDSRAAAGRDDVVRYSHRLLPALLQTAGADDEIVECGRGRGGRYDVFHAPSSEGAMLRSPCPTVVTIHDVDRLVRRSERLRCGGVHLRLRHLALQRASRVIVATEAIGEELVAELGIERELIVVIPPPRTPPVVAAAVAAPAAPDGPPTASARDLAAPTAWARDLAAATQPWSWQDVARATWRVYEGALAEPARAFSRRRAGRTPLGRSSGESSGPAPGTSARDRGSPGGRDRRSRARSGPRPARGR